MFPPAFVKAVGVEVGVPKRFTQLTTTVGEGKGIAAEEILTSTASEAVITV